MLGKDLKKGRELHKRNLIEMLLWLNHGEDIQGVN